MRTRRLQILAGITAIGVAAVLCPCQAVAQDEECWEERPPPRMVRVHGTVWEVDGTPAAERLVRFARPNTGSPEATTRPDGSYSVDVDLRRPIWVEAWVDGAVRSRYFRIAAPEAATEVEVDIQLVPPLVMSGTITVPDGRPAANMTLKARGTVMSGSCGTAGASGGGCTFDLKTDGQGWYSILLRDGDQTDYGLYISQEGVGCMGPAKITTDIDHPDVRRDFHLTEGGAVEGTVVALPEVTPLADAYVSVATGSMYHGHALGRQVATDEQGRFRLAALPPDRYDLEVKFHDDWDDIAMFGVEEGLWAMFEVKPKWGKVEVREGQTTEIEVRMVKELVVTGRVSGPDGSPLRHTVLEGMEVGTDGEGRFIHRTRPQWGPYGGVYLDSNPTLAPRVPGVGMAVPVKASFPDGAPQTIDIQLVEPGAVTGRVVYEETGRPVPGGDVCICPVQPNGPAHPFDDSGRFEVRDMLPGEYSIDAVGQKIAKCDTCPVTVTVREGETVGPIEISVRQRPSFSGRVSGVPAKKTRALPGGGSSEFRLEGVAAPAGRPQEAHVAPVDWLPDGSFTAWPLGPPTAGADLVLKGGYSDLKLVSNVIRDVDLAPVGAAPDLQFELRPGATIRGRVLAADGRTPLPYMPVVARPRGGDAMLLVPRGDRKHEPQGPPEAHTDDEGYFSITGLLAGEYEVRLDWDRECFGYATPVYVELAEGEQRSGITFRAARDWP
jgi:hypothetical protein